jgi:hypothetical protein
MSAMPSASAAAIPGISVTSIAAAGAAVPNLQQVRDPNELPQPRNLLSVEKPVPLAGGVGARKYSSMRICASLRVR